MRNRETKRKQRIAISGLSGESLCPIRQCVLERKADTCADCGELETCERLGMITRNDPEALRNLKA